MMFGIWAFDLVSPIYCFVFELSPVHKYQRPILILKMPGLDNADSIEDFVQSSG